MSENQREMPRYKSHKEVHALKISHIDYGVGENYGLLLAFADEGYARIEIEAPEAVRIKQAMQPHIETGDLGYLVVYKDGYRSWSPTKAFEEGYTRQ